MNDKIELLKYAVQKISDNRGYMGFYLKKYCSLENLTDAQLIEKLHCNYEDYFKLGLCIVPELTSKNFLDRINIISEYTHVSSLEIIRITKHVATIEHFNDIPSESMLMAARDKGENKNNNDK